MLQVKERIEAGPRWNETGLVFTTLVGTKLDASKVRRAFKDITEAGGLGATGLRASCDTRSCLCFRHPGCP
jgi:hypothetical protein